LFNLLDDRNLFFEGANRNKESITLDLSKDKGREIVYRMVPQFDVFLTNFRQKTIENLAMTYPVLSALNPRLIYVRVSSYGPKGPDKDQGGFDFQGQARSGLMYSMGEPEMPPLLIHFGLVDQVTAIVVSQAILAALFMRERTGKVKATHATILKYERKRARKYIGSFVLNRNGADYYHGLACRFVFKLVFLVREN
jgi:crotonobetainyl-CoA:carnitine CoA-transferase CaiB-like acyl-CoA transferase